MQLRYINMIVAAVAILAISFCQENEIYARAPVGRTGSVHRAAASAAARAARIAAQNPQLTAQQALTLAKFDERQAAIATGLMTSNKVLAAELAARNPQLTAQQAAQQAAQLNAQQAALLATYFGSSATATQLMAANTASATLAGQIAQQNPQLTAQQATLLTSRQISAIATQQAALIAAQNHQLTPQQATLLASIVQSPAAIATQIAESNSARAELAAQIAGQNPQISAQQATFQANQQFAAIAAELAAATTPSTATPTQQNAVNIPRVGVFPETPAFTPGFGPSGSLGNGAFQPAVPVEESGGGDVAGAAQTPPGAALQGVAQVIGATGQYDLATSAGAVNATQAESKAMRNLVQGVETFYDLRAAGREGRERERGPRPTSEELASRARAAAPHGLDAEQIDSATGALHWPEPLQHAKYDRERSAVDKYAARWAQERGLDRADQIQMRENIMAMFGVLKSQIDEIPPQEYVACRSFLQSVLYATTRSMI